MPRKSSASFIPVLKICIEIVIIFLLLFYFLQLEYIDQGTPRKISYIIYAHIKAWILLSLSWYFIGSYFGVFEMKRGGTIASYMERTLYQILIFSVILFSVSGLKRTDLLSFKNSMLFLGVFTLIIFVSRLIEFYLNRFFLSMGFDSRNVLMVDHNEFTEQYIKELKGRKDLGYHIIGSINGNKMEGISLRNFSLTEFEKAIDKFAIDIIFLSLEGQLAYQTIEDIKILASKKRVKLNYIPSPTMSGFNDLKMEYIYTYPVLQGIQNPLDYWLNRWIKRIGDLVISGMSLSIFSLTLFPIIGIMIAIDSGFPIFFKQKRAGLDGKEFYCLKFRTMRINQDSDKKITTRGDSRITNIGRILRSSSLDELPQLINVFLGDMSLVGPRPHMISQDQEFDEILQHYSLRHHVKPGITGLAQISGFRGEINSDEDMENRVRSDLYYIRNWSFSLDFVIMIKTFINIIKGDENAI